MYYHPGQVFRGGCEGGMWYMETEVGWGEKHRQGSAPTHVLGMFFLLTSLVYTPFKTPLNKVIRGIKMLRILRHN